MWLKGLCGFPSVNRVEATELRFLVKQKGGQQSQETINGKSQAFQVARAQEP
ncbi:unnamed protein product [marine sediment metagenome]|uniref:Uncharacterized protein n=1 Tax=marine sediment metagenome TaxID=412755 RepID=X1MLD3_9ZZZZ